MNNINGTAQKVVWWLLGVALMVAAGSSGFVISSFRGEMEATKVWVADLQRQISVVQAEQHRRTSAVGSVQSLGDRLVAMEVKFAELLVIRERLNILQTRMDYLTTRIERGFDSIEHRAKGGDK